MEPPSPNKRPRSRRVHSVSSSSGQSPNPSSLPSDIVRHQNRINRLISSLHDLPSSSSSQSDRCSLERALDELLESYVHESDEDLLQLDPLLRESIKRCSRRRDTIHNSISWPLPIDITIEVFSRLDTKSLVQASAGCTMFRGCATNPICYANIDLTAKDVNDGVVHKMLLTAEKELRSLKVGCPDESTNSSLSGSCLAPLSYKDGFLGNLLRSLYIYNHKWLENDILFNVLRHCSNLTDLKIVGLNIKLLDEVIPLLTRNLQHLYLEKPRSGGSSFRRGSSFVRNCPNLVSLSLIGFEIGERMGCILFKGFRKLKYLNLTRAGDIKGNFLRDVTEDFVLETLILRNYTTVTEDLTCERRLPHDHRYWNHTTPKFSMEELLNARPDLQLVVQFRTFWMHSTFTSSVEIHDDHHHNHHQQH